MSDAPHEAVVDDTGEEGASAGRRIRPGSGCLVRGMIGIVVLVALGIAIGEIFDQGENAKQPARSYNAGPAAEYKQGDVNEFDQEHLFLVRLPDGEFLAFYDKSSRQQELGGSCRISYDENAGVGTLAPIPGLGGAFVEDCEGSRVVWRVDGKFSFGNGYGDLDRFQTIIDDNGDVVIDLSSRTCTRGKAGFAPYEVRTCY
jgi:hypothetical protein